MMRTATIVLLVALVGAGSVSANPVAYDAIYVDFDPGSYVSQIYPAPFETVEAFIMLDMLGSYVDFLSVSFKISVTPGIMMDEPIVESLLPGGAMVGDWWSGMTLTSTECIDPSAYPYPIARVTFDYAGGAGAITIGDHPVYPRWVVDCNNGTHIYCVLWHGGIGQPAPPGDCEGQPVESASWSVIKSLYR